MCAHQEKRGHKLDFPSSPVVKNPSVNAGDTDSIPGLERPHNAANQLSQCATATNPVLLSPRAATSDPVRYAY